MCTTAGIPPAGSVGRSKSVPVRGRRREVGVTSYLSPYVVLATVALAGVGFVAAAYGVNRLLAPRRPTPEKLLTYESGVDPVGEGWAHTHVRYYVYAFLYVVFAVDAVYVFPWATVFASPGFGTTTLVEMFVFLGLLATGIVYALRRGVLTWQ
ncbi:MAG: NADH-quinone oxidoreductase subunit A [Jiangellaceae bacterium]|nr:NADH-quinone oxidoreductase subunit A [Jiangellaceae bacterium]